MRMILLTEAQAAMARGPALQPRRVDAGPHIGAFVLPTRVIEDPDHAEHRDLLAGLPQAEIDPDAAWPSPEDA
jgi:hypothetical protein